MSEQEANRQSMPLHVKILIAMVIGTIVGVWANPGEVDVTVPVTGSITESDGKVTLLETTTGVDDSPQELYSASWPSPEQFAKSFPELSSLVETGGTTNVEVTDTKARLSHSIKGVSVTWQRSHNGNPIVTESSCNLSQQEEVFPQFHLRHWSMVKCRLTFCTIKLSS